MDSVSHMFSSNSMEVLPDTKLTEACFTPFKLFNTVFTLAAHPAHPIPVTLKLFFVIFFAKVVPPHGMPFTISVTSFMKFSAA